MFTGIVEEIGTVKKIKREKSFAILEISAQTVLEETNVVDSIAVY